MKKLLIIASVVLLSGCGAKYTYAYPYDENCIIIKATDTDVPSIKPGIYCKVEIKQP